MEYIDGKKVAASVKERVKTQIENDSMLKEKRPYLACIIVEGNSASEVYVAAKQKACEECGILSRLVRLKNNVTQAELIAAIEELNKDESVTGILLQLPLPSQLDDVDAINHISPQKDVDCLTKENLGAMFSKISLIAPCTATGIMELLRSINVNLSGKRAVVVGRSLLVGKSIATLLEQADATVTICHSKTKNLEKITRQADILVVAIGKERFINSKHIKKGAVIIDVGISRTNEGLKGDVDQDDVKGKCSYLTPVPGGVGPMTVACLMLNTLILAKRQGEDERNNL